MKTFKLISLLLAMLIINSCTADSVEKEEENTVINESEANDPNEINGGLMSGIYPFYQHHLILSFQDASGNDLVKGIGFDVWQPGEIYITGVEDDSGGEIKRELYTLEIEFEDEVPNVWKPAPASLINGFPAYILTERVPVMGLCKGWSDYNHVELNGNYDYLSFGTQSYKDMDIPFAEKITFKLTCPYLFSDNEAHEIVTWWKLYIEETGVQNTICYRVEFGGKEFITNNKVFSVATVVFDR